MLAGERADRLDARLAGLPYMPTQTDDEYVNERARRNRPWSILDLQAVRQAALDLVRTHEPQDLPNGETRASVDGKAFWRLLGALDREG